MNASPIITLAKIGRLSLLHDLCRELLVPEAVVAEILAGPSSDPARRSIEAGWGARAAAGNVASDLLEWGLGAGETAVLALAMERKQATAVLDDAAARLCARAFGLDVIGTVGVVLRAKKRALISSVADEITALRGAGLRLDDAMVRAVLNSIGEAWEQE
ncbi:MAG: DUF3368 domain-containing protein [Pirellulales bacterium]|nr:DUF3368 domain-containing protein [Pirellulales bacterium]